MQELKEEEKKKDLKSERIADESLNIINNVFALLFRVHGRMNSINYFLGGFFSYIPIILPN